MIPGMIPLLHPTGKLPEITYRTNSVYYPVPSKFTTHTFTAVPIGTAAAGRLVVASFLYIEATTGPLTMTVTIGGVAATAIPGASIRGADVTTAHMRTFMAVVPTGTTANIAVTLSGVVSMLSLGCWTITDLRSTTPTDTAAIITSPPGATSLNCNVSANGVGFGYSFSEPLSTWVGLTENFDLSTFGFYFTGASASSLPAATPRTISVSQGAWSVAATWR